MFRVEVLVILITIICLEQLLVLVADDYGLRLCGKLRQRLRIVHLAGILIGLVEAAETAELHLMETVEVGYFYVEVAHNEVGKVKLRHLEEQLILVDRVGTIYQKELEIGQTVGRECLPLGCIVVVKHYVSPCPHVAETEAAAPQAPPCVHTVDYHAGHLTDPALRILLHHGLHIGKTALGIAIIEFVQTSDKQELVAVGTQREPGFGHTDIACHFVIAVFLERFVCSCVDRVFDMRAKTGVLLEVRV